MEKFEREKKSCPKIKEDEAKWKRRRNGARVTAKDWILTLEIESRG